MNGLFTQSDVVRDLQTEPLRHPNPMAWKESRLAFDISGVPQL